MGFLISGPITLFPKSKLTISNGEHLEKIDHAVISFLMFKVLASIQVDDLSTGSSRARPRKPAERNANKQKLTLGVN